MHKFQVRSEYIVALEEDKVHDIWLDASKTVKMKVQLIDANHIFGSVMFLLEGYFGRILYTGDFRYDAKILRHPALSSPNIDDEDDTTVDKILNNNKKNLKLIENDSDNEIPLSSTLKFDALYLDDTFLDKEHYEFPTKDEAGNEILEIVTSFSSEDSKILIAVDTIGKEELLVQLSLKLQSLVVVTTERMLMIKQLMKNGVDIPDIFTTNPEDGRIHTVPKKDLSVKRIIQERISNPNTIGIFPSGLSYKSGRNFREQFIFVCISNYESFSLFENSSLFI